MSEEGRDIAAAETEFLAIFEREDEKIRKEMAIPFLKEFLKYYKYAKILFKSQENYTDGELQKKTQNLFLNAMNTLEISGNTTESKAKNLGKAFGEFLGAMEFGITHERLYLFKSDFESYLAIINDIAKRLHMLGNKVRLNFIQRRVQRIAREHGRTLTADKKKFIAAVAAIFAKA